MESMMNSSDMGTVQNYKSKGNLKRNKEPIMALKV